jgi:RNA polymerase sigma factor (sigma-70 family)
MAYMSGTSTGWPGSSADSDEELLVQALNAPEGDLRAFEGLVLRYQKRVVANCHGITRDSNNAEDLAQEVLVKVFYGLRGFERKSSFGRWLQRIKINHCLNHLKKAGGHSFVDVGDPEADEFDELTVKVTAEQLAGAISDRKTISAVLESMPSTLRIPLVSAAAPIDCTFSYRNLNSSRARLILILVADRPIPRDRATSS